MPLQIAIKIMAAYLIITIVILNRIYRRMKFKKLIDRTFASYQEMTAKEMTKIRIEKMNETHIESLM